MYLVNFSYSKLLTSSVKASTTPPGVSGYSSEYPSVSTSGIPLPVEITDVVPTAKIAIIANEVTPPIHIYASFNFFIFSNPFLARVFTFINFL